jgi:membrane carboxypeptidase/penicillin-binding protein
MQRVGVRSLGNDSSRFGLSLTLGGGEVTLLELTRAYSIFSNQGAYVPSTSILCVLNSKNEIIYQYEGSCPSGSETARTVNQRGFGTQVLDPELRLLSVIF